MNEEQLFNFLKFWRKNSLKELDATTEEEADKMPEGFSNNLRWNFGHILVITESILAQKLGGVMDIPKFYVEYFNRGTSPADWKEAPPSLDELRRSLEAQPQRLEEALKGRMAETLKEPMMGMTTVGELVVFAAGHEALHVGTIKGLKKSL